MRIGINICDISACPSTVSQQRQRSFQASTSANVRFAPAGQPLTPATRGLRLLGSFQRQATRACLSAAAALQYQRRAASHMCSHHTYSCSEGRHQCGLGIGSETASASASALRQLQLQLQRAPCGSFSFSVQRAPVRQLQLQRSASACAAPPASAFSERLCGSFCFSFSNSIGEATSAAARAPQWQQSDGDCSIVGIDCTATSAVSSHYQQPRQFSNSIAHECGSSSFLNSASASAASLRPSASATCSLHLRGSFQQQRCVSMQQQQQPLELQRQR